MLLTFTTLYIIWLAELFCMASAVNIYLNLMQIKIGSFIRQSPAFIF